MRHTLSYSACAQEPHRSVCGSFPTPLTLGVVSLCGHSVIIQLVTSMWKLLFPDFVSFLFSLFLWYLQPFLPRAARVPPSGASCLLGAGSAAFQEVPLSRPWWSHRQVVLFFRPSLMFGAGFLIVGLTVCSCPAVFLGR